MYNDVLTHNEIVPYNSIETIGFKVFSDDLSKIPLESSTSRVINTISPNSYGIATRDQEFKQALKLSDYLVLDGVYFAFASILLKGRNIKRNQGPDVFYHFMKRANEAGKKVFFLGSTPQTLKLIKQKAAFLYPHIKVETYSPPFKPEFNEHDNNEIRSEEHTSELQSRPHLVCRLLL